MKSIGTRIACVFCVVLFLVPVVIAATTQVAVSPINTRAMEKTGEKSVIPLKTITKTALNILQSSNLLITSIESPSHANPSTLLPITDTIKNSGSDASGIFTVRYYLSQKPSMLPESILIGERKGSSISPGAQVTSMISVPLSAQIPLGTYYLGGQLVIANVSPDTTPGPAKFNPTPVKLTGSTPSSEKGAPLWEKTYGTAEDEFTWEVNAVPDGGFVVTGRIISPGGDSDILAMRYDSRGEIVWNEAIGGPGEQTGTCFAPTEDGGFLIVGDTMPALEKRTHAYAVKIDGNGKVVWESTFGRGLDDRFFCQEKTKDGGFIFNGHTHSFGSGNGDGWLVKVDYTGKEVWNRTYGGKDEDALWDVVQTRDGGYMALGRTEPGGPGNSDLWLLRTDSEGNEIWSRTYGGSTYDIGRVIKRTSDGNYITVGSTESSGSGSTDFYCLKFDDDGNIIFEKTYGGPEHDSASFVAETIDGGYLFAGHTYSFGVGNSDGWLVKADRNGNKVWDKTYGGLQFDSIVGLTRMPDGGFIFVGDTYSSGKGGSDVWIGRLGPNAFIRQ